MATEYKKYIPTLRFPEFQNDGEWKRCKLSDVAVRKGKKNTKGIELPVYTNSATSGVISQEDYFDREIVTKENLVNYGIIEPNDFVYNPRVSVTAPVGPISRNKLSCGIMSPLYLIFGFNGGDINFFEYYFKGNSWHNYLRAKANYGARFDRINIGTKEFMDMPIPYPSLAEQKKVADCLSSLDKYIDATKRKFELLKEHKKGLMQCLFPAKGKTTPELRFQEFQNDGEWVEKKVSNIFDQITRGYVLPVSETHQSPDDTYKYPVYSSQTANNGLMGYYNKYLFKNAITWTTDGANAGTVMLRRGEFFCTNVCGVLISHRGYANGCISEIIATHAKEHVSYVGNPKLMNNVMGEIEICIPPTIDEQIKIADCLYKVDQIISSHEKKIKSLELHKRGLIQQLFPKL